MERGLLWLPLLGLFIWLAWAGWHETQKIAAYQVWAQGFQRAKYDLYAVLGQNDADLTWGKPTHRGPIEIQTISLQNVRSLRLLVDGQPIDLTLTDMSSRQGRSIYIELEAFQSGNRLQIPFTEVPLAVQWGQHLQRELQRLHPPSSS
ncbi:hypothetical protein DO97_19475 [Neosynechococcus sphagnicola sy1]|uniref:Uncharacterized protein n=1 Tax=Neosynechococcus sphagnicola sy1 TaxID=1497020 RepID=A0A098TKU6_9CYAN|nr:hypothetical protein [Neosynechococcus sphagnicola]KGF71458.1 hypothetical protein DO97_19475 [Neosynechococcus sphagnicola sy1]